MAEIQARMLEIELRRVKGDPHALRELIETQGKIEDFFWEHPGNPLPEDLQKASENAKQKTLDSLKGSELGPHISSQDVNTLISRAREARLKNHEADKAFGLYQDWRANYPELNELLPESIRKQVVEYQERLGLNKKRPGLVVADESKGSCQDGLGTLLERASGPGH
jgi:hypothetical protein